MKRRVNEILEFLKFIRDLTTEDKELNERVKDLLIRVKRSGLTNDLKTEIKEIVREVYGDRAKDVLKTLPL